MEDSTGKRSRSGNTGTSGFDGGRSASSNVPPGAHLIPGMVSPPMYGGMPAMLGPDGTWSSGAHPYAVQGVIPAQQMQSHLVGSSPQQAPPPHGGVPAWWTLGAVSTTSTTTTAGLGSDTQQRDGKSPGGRLPPVAMQSTSSSWPDPHLQAMLFEAHNLARQQPQLHPSMHHHHHNRAPPHYSQASIPSMHTYSPGYPSTSLHGVDPTAAHMLAAGYFFGARGPPASPPPFPLMMGSPIHTTGNPTHESEPAPPSAASPHGKVRKPRPTSARDQDQKRGTQEGGGDDKPVKLEHDDAGNGDVGTTRTSALRRKRERLSDGDDEDDEDAKSEGDEDVADNISEASNGCAPARMVRLRVGRWTPKEEELFRKGVATYGIGSWAKVAKVVGTRTTEQTRSHGSFLSLSHIITVHQSFVLTRAHTQPNKAPHGSVHQLDHARTPDEHACVPSTNTRNPA